MLSSRSSPKAPLLLWTIPSGPQLLPKDWIIVFCFGGFGAVPGFSTSMMRFAQMDRETFERFEKLQAEIQREKAEAPRPGTGTLKFVKESQAEIERKFGIRQGALGGCPTLSRLLR